LAAQFAKIIDFAIIGERIGMILLLVNHGLLAALGIDDKEAMVRQRGARRDPASLSIRSAVAHRPSHALNHWTLMREILFPIDPAGDATHSINPFLVTQLSLIRPVALSVVPGAFPPAKTPLRIAGTQII